MQKLQDLIDKFGFYTKDAGCINKDVLIKFGIFANNNDKDIISDFNYLTESLEDIDLSFLNKIDNKVLIPDFFDVNNLFIKGLLNQGYLTECLGNINLTNKLFDKIKEFKQNN